MELDPARDPVESDEEGFEISETNTDVFPNNFGVYSEHATAALCPFDSILHKIRGSESKTLFGVD
jgi:hypothetical protein